MSGWYKIKRGVLDHELFAPSGKWSRFEAWVWMIENAAFRDAEINIGGKPYTVERGSLCFSERFLADKFGWSQKSLRTFLDALEAHNAIRQGVASTGQGMKSKRKQITLCNYDKYQSDGSKTESKENQNGSKEERIKKYTSYEGSVSAAADPAKIMFDAGIRLMGDAGVPERQARAIIGRWRTQHGAEAVIAALGRAQREGAIDPVSFIEGCFRFSARKSSQSAESSYGAFGHIPEVG